MSSDIVEFHFKITIQDDDYFNETIVDARPPIQHKYLVVKTKSLFRELNRVKTESPEYFKEFFSCSRCLRELLKLITDNSPLITDFAEWPSYRRKKDFIDDK